MSRRKVLSAAVLAATAGLGAVAAVPATAAGGCSSDCAASTNVTFSLGASSGLSISVPGNSDVDLGTATSNILGTTVSGSLHPTTVTDTRGSLLAAWTVTVSTSGFDGSGGAAGETIAADRASMYLDAVALLSDAVALATGGLLPTSVTTQANPVTLSSGGGTLMAGTTTGSGAITYTPDISISIPANAVAGTYTGSVTQTVS